MPEYTVLTVLAVVLLVVAEVAWLRTGIFRSLQYWVALAIVLAFQVPVDGWLTKLSDPIVLYNPVHHSSLRVPWDIPIEDFGFGWAMVTATILSWLVLGRRGERSSTQPSRAEPSGPHPSGQGERP